MLTRETFSAKGYRIVRQLLNESARRRLANVLFSLVQNGSLDYDDGQVERAYSGYRVPETESLLQSLCPLVSETTACSLLPAYSYVRVYCRGAVLTRHIDRPSCEVSVTLTVKADSPSAWPIFLAVDEKTIRVELHEGDALVYRGHDLPHWREPFEGHRQIQVFLHYICEGGPHMEYLFDKRGGLRLSSDVPQTGCSPSKEAVPH